VNVGAFERTTLPVPVLVVVPVPPRATGRVPVVIFAVSKAGILAASRVPDAILVALSAVSPEPSPKNVAAVTFPVTRMLLSAVSEVVTFENWIVCGVTLPFAVVFARVWVVATTSTVPSWSVPPTLRFEEVVTPVVTFVKFTVPVTSEPVG
jgi:hypothetical protein